MVAKKKPTAEYVPIGKEISIESAFIQAASALDLAAEFAIDCKDPSALAQVAQIWVEMGAHLISAVEETSEESDEDPTAINPRGFESNALTARRKEKEDAST